MTQEENMGSKAQDNGCPLSVDYPDEYETAQQISMIVGRGIRQKPSFRHRLPEMARRLGWPVIFHDWLQTAAVLGLYLAVGLGAATALGRDPLIPAERVYGAIFVCSPLLYVLVLALFLIRPDRSAAAETEKACAYTPYQVAAVRMLLLGLAGAAVNGVIVAYLSVVRSELSLPLALLLSSSSLFLFAAGLLFALLHFRSRRSQLTLGALLFCALLCLLPFAQPLSMLTARMPQSLCAALSAAGMLLYWLSIKKLYTFRPSGGTLIC